MIFENKEKETAAVALLANFISKKESAGKLFIIANDLFRSITDAEKEALSHAQTVNNLNGKIHSLQKQVLLGKVKSGERHLLRQELENAKAALEVLGTALDNQRESYCGAEELLSETRAEIKELHAQLIDEKTFAFFTTRHSEADQNMGRRGEVVWLDADEKTLWRKQWRTRTFNALFASVLNNTDQFDRMCALIALIKGEAFRVRIVSGFLLPGTRNQVFDAIGDCISVPSDLDFENAFEEILRGRVKFV